MQLKLAVIFILFILFVIFFNKKKFIIYAIILTLFLEARVFSFYFAGARIRIVQLVEIIAILIIILALLFNKIALKKTPIDLFLWAYILANFISLINAPLIERSLKIFILLVSLALLYCIIVNLVTEIELFNKAFNLLLYVGIAEILYGIYQVLAGMCNHYLNFNLPIGFAGIVHKKFIGSPWGRPYGTFVEPDWYGAISMFYALLFISLYFSRLVRRKYFYLIGMIISILGMLISFVRTSWIGFFGGLLLLSFLGSKIKLSKIRLVSYVKILFLLSFFVLTLSISWPAFSNIIKGRLSTKGDAGISTSNTRFVCMIHAFNLFLNHPIIGNGPGSFAIQGIGSVYEAGGEFSLERRYDPGLLTTVLEDTGIIGFILFLLLSRRFLKYNLKAIPLISNRYQIISMGLLAGISGLFISYVFTHGFWIPFTWVFLGFNICSLRLGLIENERKKLAKL